MNKSVRMITVANKLNAEKLKLDFLAWRLLQSEKTEIIEFHLMPGEVIEDHSNEHNVNFYIMQGNGIFSLDGETIPLKKGDTIHAESNLIRSWKNTGSRRLKVLVIKEL